MPLKLVLKTEELYRVILIGGILVLAWTSFTFPIHPDEKVFIKVTETIVQGGAPYRDFFDNKPPGIYLLLVPFVVVFGKNMLILRLIPFAANLTIGYVLILLCRTIKIKREVLVAGLYLLISPYYQSNFILTEVPMTLCLLIGTYLLVVYHKTGQSREVGWVGFWVGMAVLFKQPALLYSLIFPFFLLYKQKGSSQRKNVLLLGTYLSGLLLPIIICGLYLASHNILAISYQQIIAYNLNSYPPFSIFDTVLFIPQILFPIVLLWVFIRYFIKKSRIKPYYFYFISSLIFIYSPFLLFRPYHHYWMPVLPFILLLFFSKKDPSLN